MSRHRPHVRRRTHCTLDLLMFFEQRSNILDLDLLPRITTTAEASRSRSAASRAPRSSPREPSRVEATPPCRRPAQAANCPRSRLSMNRASRASRAASGSGTASGAPRGARNVIGRGLPVSRPQSGARPGPSLGLSRGQVKPPTRHASPDQRGSLCESPRASNAHDDGETAEDGASGGKLGMCLWSASHLAWKAPRPMLLSAIFEKKKDPSSDPR